MKTNFSNEQLAEQVINEEKKYLEARHSMPTAHYLYRPPRENMDSKEERRTPTSLRWNKLWATKGRFRRFGLYNYCSRNCASSAVPQRRGLSTNWLEEPQSETSATSGVLLTTTPLSFSSKPSTPSVPRGIKRKREKTSWWSTVFC